MAARIDKIVISELAASDLLLGGGPLLPMLSLGKGAINKRKE